MLRIEYPDAVAVDVVTKLAHAAADVAQKTGAGYYRTYKDLAQAAGIGDLTEQRLAAAFTEWDRRYREEPERFESEARRLVHGTPETYGASAAPYLLALLAGEV